MRVPTSFGSTYEGLKPSSRRPRARAIRCFGSTYEGLKRENFDNRHGSPPCFGSTYEGLKRSFPRSWSAMTAVLAVPMRA